MTEFLRLVQPDEARVLLLSHILAALPDAEIVATYAALSRVTAQPVTAPHALPEFPRSTVDGYAIRARDSFGATPAQPAYFELVGEIPMGSATDVELGRGQCALIHTGGMLPSGADAVVMLEYVQVATGDLGTMSVGEIEVLRAAAPGENGISAGEDVKQGQVAIPSGTVLRPPEIGGLMALGVTTIAVKRRPRKLRRNHPSIMRRRWRKPSVSVGSMVSKKAWTRNGMPCASHPADRNRIGPTRTRNAPAR